MIVFADSGSAMRVESMNKVQDWIDENATKNEKTYVAGIVPQIFESTRTVAASKKRNFEMSGLTSSQILFRLMSTKTALLSNNSSLSARHTQKRRHKVLPMQSLISSMFSRSRPTLVPMSRF